MINCAANVGGIGLNSANSEEFLGSNLMFDMSLLNAAKSAGVPRAMLIGCSCMYPAGIERPIQESDLLTGQLESTNRANAISKIAASGYADELSALYEVQYKTIIPSNLYGPGDNFDLHRSHIVGAALRKAHEAVAAGSTEINVWGDGKNLRELTFVDDVAGWILSQIDTFDSWPSYLNLGSGYVYTVNQIYEACLSVVGGQKIRLAHDHTRPGGMRQKYMDSEIAKKSFGWSNFTPLEEGLIATYSDFLSGVSRKL